MKSLIDFFRKKTKKEKELMDLFSSPRFLYYLNGEDEIENNEKKERDYEGDYNGTFDY